MTRITLLLALALGAPAVAQAPAAGTRQVRIDISPAGQAVVKRYLGTPDPVIVRQAGQLRAIAQQMQALSSAPRLDLTRMEQLLRQQEQAQVGIQRRGNDRMLAMLRELPEADRLKFLRGLRRGPVAAKPPVR